MLPVAIAPLSQCGADASVFRDPIVNFAYGGRADFRGKHNALYNFLSAPGLSVNVKTEEAVFFAHHGVLTVNGTFLTEAHVTAQLSPQKRATASFWASELDPNNFGWRVVNGTCVGRAFHFGNRGKKDCFDLKMAMGYSSATFELGNWTVTVKGMPSCDTGHDCLIKGPAHRIDVSFTARGNAPIRHKPHGLIGQSFATPGLARNGKQDVYPFAGMYTTTAQAEGAIEGTASEYEMQSAFATEFAFSRFNAAKDDRASVEGSKATDIVDASSIERVADPARRLSEAPCPPPPVLSPPSPPKDSDSDGFPDADEGTADTDSDGIPDNLDPDGDGNGTPDAEESCLTAPGGLDQATIRAWAESISQLPGRERCGYTYGGHYSSSPCPSPGPIDWVERERNGIGRCCGGVYVGANPSVHNNNRVKTVKCRSMFSGEEFDCKNCRVLPRNVPSSYPSPCFFSDCFGDGWGISTGNGEVTVSRPSKPGLKPNEWGAGLRVYCEGDTSPGCIDPV